MSKIIELFGRPTQSEQQSDWQTVIGQQRCPYLNRTCLKIRKSSPEISIGTCSVLYGKSERPLIICPHRLLERRQTFTDCLHLLSLHEPGNELHIVGEIAIPGGNVDYFLVSVKDETVRDFVGIELQALDTNGTVWPERQRFLQSQGCKVSVADVTSNKRYGINWKMTAKTTLIQLHHKIQTFEGLNKHLVLVIQDSFLDYMRRAFQFDHLRTALSGDAMHLHSYRLSATSQGSSRISLASRFSTDAAGVAKFLGLQEDANIELNQIMQQVETKISAATLFTL